MAFYSQGKKRLNNQTVNPIALLIKKFSFQSGSSPQLNLIKTTIKAKEFDSNKLPIKDLQGFFFFGVFS